MVPLSLAHSIWLLTAQWLLHLNQPTTWFKEHHSMHDEHGGQCGVVGHDMYLCHLLYPLEFPLDTLNFGTKGNIWEIHFRNIFYWWKHYVVNLPPISHGAGKFPHDPQNEQTMDSSKLYTVTYKQTIDPWHTFCLTNVQGATYAEQTEPDLRNKSVFCGTKNYHSQWLNTWSPAGTRHVQFGLVDSSSRQLLSVYELYIVTVVICSYFLLAKQERQLLVSWKRLVSADPSLGWEAPNGMHVLLVPLCHRPNRPLGAAFVPRPHWGLWDSLCFHIMITVHCINL